MKGIRNLKIKNKLIVIILSSTLLVLTVGFTSIIIYNQSMLQKSFTNEGITTAEVLASGLVSVMLFGSGEEAEKDLSKLKTLSPNITNVLIYNDKEEQFAAYHRSDEDKIKAPLVPKSPSTEFRDRHLHIFHPIIYKNMKHGTVYLRISTVELERKINKLIMAMLLIVLILIPLSLFLATKLQAIISKPLLELGNVTKKVSAEGNYSLRMKRVSSDEIGMLYDGFNDMMEQIQNRDTQRDRVENELKAAEFFLSSVMESMPSTLITTNRNGTVTQWNKAAVRLTDIAVDDAIGKSLWELIPDFEKYRDTIDKISNTKKTVQFYKELVIIKESTLYLNVTIFPLLDTQARRFVIMINNVTDIELKEQQLRQSQKMETVGTLAGGLAHDFNNVLGGIIGTISLFKYKISKKRQVTEKDVKKYFNTIEDSANRASDMVQHLLSLTRKQELSFEPADLNTIVESTVKICKNTFDKSIDINAVYSKEPATTNVDPTMIEQTLLNLCINASHAMTLMRTDAEKYGGTLNILLEKVRPDKYTVKFRLHPEYNEGEEYWRISVEDTGVGMTESTLSKIFDPFFTTKREGKGTGLGLAMVYTIMKQHNGFIDVYSQEDIGTTFHLYLPVYKSTGEVKTVAEKEEIHMGKGLILVIDDEEIMRQTAKSILEECGYDVLMAGNGEEGVELYKTNKEKITAVLLDMVMPKMSGKQAYIELAKINRDIKVLLASGFKQDGRVESILELGVNGFIQKPYSLMKLANSLHKVITTSN
jgi:PAS domain S-box-containing protein